LTNQSEGGTKCRPLILRRRSAAFRAFGACISPRQNKVRSYAIQILSQNALPNKKNFCYNEGALNLNRSSFLMAVSGQFKATWIECTGAAI
jgi:hypothetical protein